MRRTLAAAAPAGGVFAEAAAGLAAEQITTNATGNTTAPGEEALEPEFTVTP